MQEGLSALKIILRRGLSVSSGSKISRTAELMVFNSIISKGLKYSGYSNDQDMGAMIVHDE
jgi:hypothetical protein